MTSFTTVEAVSISKDNGEHPSGNFGGDDVRIYIDDILLTGANQGEHLATLGRVLS
jgi:hypothetical protein